MGAEAAEPPAAPVAQERTPSAGIARAQTSPAGIARAQPPAVDEAAPVTSRRAVPVAEPAAPDAAARAPQALEPADEDVALSDRWNELVRRLIDTAAVSGLVRELAWQSVLLRIESASPVAWHLRVEHEALRSQGLRDKLAIAVAEAIGAPVQLLLEHGVPRTSPALREAAERQRRQRLAEQTIHEDPVVRELLGQFSTARIVPGSIKPL